MTGLTKEQIEIEVEKRFPGDVVTEVCEVASFDTLDITEVWVLEKKRSFATRFVIEYPNKDADYVDSVQKLIKHINKLANYKYDPSLLTQSRLAEGKFYVASVVVLIVVVAVAYVFVRSGELSSATANGLVAGIVASGCIHFFGKWVMPKIPGLS